MQSAIPLACFLSMIRPPGVQFENSLLQIAPVDKAKCPFIKDGNDIGFRLYTRHNPTVYHELTIGDDEKLFASSIDYHAPTVIYFHAFMETPDDGSAASVREAYVLRGDTNIIMVDASRLEAGPWYFTAAENTWYIGRFAAQFIDYLVSRGLDLSKTHLVGHSLGAQAAGVAGSSLKSGRVSRITGLDPALPLFNHLPPEQRLDQSDAEFVDVIHTDAGIFGVNQPVGHVDFYPNGGISPQPGCELEVVIPQHLLLNKCDKNTRLGTYKFYLTPTVQKSTETLARNLQKLFTYIQIAKTDINLKLKPVQVRKDDKELVYTSLDSDSTEVEDREVKEEKRKAIIKGNLEEKEEQTSENSTVLHQEEFKEDYSKHRDDLEELTSKDVPYYPEGTLYDKTKQLFDKIKESQQSVTTTKYEIVQHHDTIKSHETHNESKFKQISRFTDQSKDDIRNVSKSKDNNEDLKEHTEGQNPGKTSIEITGQLEDQIMVESEAHHRVVRPEGIDDDKRRNFARTKHVPIEKRNKDEITLKNSADDILKSAFGNVEENIQIDDDTNHEEQIIQSEISVAEQDIQNKNDESKQIIQPHLENIQNEHNQNENVKQLIQALAENQDILTSIPEVVRRLFSSAEYHFGAIDATSGLNPEDQSTDIRQSLPDFKRPLTRHDPLSATDGFSSNPSTELRHTPNPSAEIRQSLPEFERLFPSSRYESISAITESLKRPFPSSRNTPPISGTTDGLTNNPSTKIRQSLPDIKQLLPFIRQELPIPNTDKTNTKKRQRRFIPFFKRSETEENENFLFKMLNFLIKNRRSIPVYSVMREINTLVKSAQGELNHVTKERNNYIGAPPPILAPVSYTLELGNESKTVAFVKRLLGLAPKGDRLTINGSGK